MTLEQALRILESHRTDLKALGVAHAAVFGSLARGDAGPASDVDVLVDLAEGRSLGLFELGRIQQQLEGWLGCPVDLARSDRLRPGAAREAAREAVRAF